MRLSGRVLLPAATMVAFTIAAPGSAAAGPAWQTDFDGDGFADLAVSDDSDEECNINGGAVSIVRGGPEGLDGSLVQRISPCGFQAMFGNTIAAGDFDGNGHGDLIASSPGETSAQKISVYDGGAGGLVRGREVYWHEVLPRQPRLTFTAFGGAMSAGDFNGDSFDDLAVGAPGLQVGKAERAGAVVIIPGSARGIRPGRARLITQKTRGVTGVPETGDRFGAVLEARGDYDGDGRADLAVGVEEGIAGRPGAGAVHLLVSGERGLHGRRLDDRVWHQGVRGVPGAVESEDGFGAALVAGRFDGTGPDDLAIGVPGEDLGGHVDAGAVAVVPGRAGGPVASGSRMLDQGTRDVPGDRQAGRGFGGTLAAGNFGRSPADDLAVRAGGSGDEQVIVLYGTEDAGLPGPYPQIWRPTNPRLPGDHLGGDLFGHALAASDYGRSTEADLAIGLPWQQPGGAVNVLYGGPRGLSLTGAQLWSPELPGLSGPVFASSFFGGSVL